MAPSIFVTVSVFAWVESLSCREVSNCGRMCRFSWLITNHSVSQALKAAPGDQFTLVTSPTALHGPRNRDVDGTEGDGEDGDAAPQPTLLCSCIPLQGLQQQKESARNWSQAILGSVSNMPTENNSQASERHGAPALYQEVLNLYVL